MCKNTSNKGKEKINELKEIFKSFPSNKSNKTENELLSEDFYDAQGVMLRTIERQEDQNVYGLVSKSAVVDSVDAMYEFKEFTNFTAIDILNDLKEEGIVYEPIRGYIHVIQPIMVFE